MEIQTRSTSRNTAECTPIVLRQGDRVRLVFVPTLVNNEGFPEACVRGHFVYQKKLKKEEWTPIATVPLTSLKSGEGYKLELHAGEVLALARGLAPLYRLYRQQGISQGQATFVKLEAGLARFMALGETELASFLETHREDAATTFLKLIRWMAASPHGAAAASRIAAMQPEELPSVTVLLGLAAVKSALDYWRQNQQNSSEEFWQRALGERVYVLSQVFAYPVVVIGQKAYVGGKRLSNTGGNIVDFLAAVESTDAVVLIEIKTPNSHLLGAEYRSGIYPLSGDLTGAIAQALAYRQSLMRDYNSIVADSPKRFTLGEPRCLVVAGNAQRELASGAMRDSFELQRERLQGIAVVTYDELFRRLQRFVDLLEGLDT